MGLVSAKTSYLFGLIITGKDVSKGGGGDDEQSAGLDLMLHDNRLVAANGTVVAV